ncbi:MAG: sulfite exporter TauE/SafE family protein, partial [Pirellulales bacterium]|nr:sulfite exporter TauE/SafE family protein [Pirellulales bacterium]
MMTRIIIASLAVFAIAVPCTMAGRGGGNFYVPALVATGQPIHQAATTGQLTLLLTACAGMLVFHKHGLVDWKLALVLSPATDAMAFVGGYLAHLMPGASLKFILAGLLGNRSQTGDWLIFSPFQGRKMCLSPSPPRGTVPFS